MGNDSDHGAISIRQVVRENLASFIGFDLLYRLMAGVIFTPLVAWLATYLIELSGSGAISNYDIAGFILSVNGQIFIAVVVSMAFAMTFFEFGGLISIAVAGLNGVKVRLPSLALFLIKSLPRILRLSLRQFVVYLAIAVPLLAITGAAYLYFLTESDINYYLIAKPREFWITAAIAVLCSAAFVLIAGRFFLNWIFAIPILLFEKKSPRRALSASSKIAKAHRKELLKMLLLWVGQSLIYGGVLWVILFLLKWVLLGLAGNNVTLVLSMTAFIAVIQLISVVMLGVIISASLACMITKRFVEYDNDIHLPGVLQSDDGGMIVKAVKMLRIGWVSLLILTAASIFVGYQIINTTPPDVDTGITAHRGSSITAPENTMAAIMLAVEEGADYVEIDVQETSDGVIVLVHDKDLKRVFGIEKGIWEVSYDELKDLDSGGWFSPEYSDQRLATLDEVIKAVKGRAKLNIELKFNGHQKQLAKEVVRIVRENDFVDDCILTSLDLAGLKRARQAGPEFRTGLIVTTALGDVTKLGGELISVSAGAVTRDLIARAHHAGLEVHVWTVNDVPMMNRMLGMGVDQIITDDPKLLGRVIDERASLSPAELTLLRLAEIGENRIAFK